MTETELNTVLHYQRAHPELDFDEACRRAGVSTEEPDAAELERRRGAAVQFMRASGSSWDEVARLFRYPPYHHDQPLRDERQPPDGEQPQLDRLLVYVRQGCPTRRLSGWWGRSNDSR
jgi:hypothetical protein